MGVGTARSWRVAVLGVLAHAACVDPCVLSGAPCDSAADCGDGQVCRLRRGFELGCLFAAGTCETGRCGSVADCDPGQCCHPDDNACVPAADYTGACDPRTCDRCPGPEERRDAGGVDSGGPDASVDSGPPPECTRDEDCALSERCRADACRTICSRASDCPGSTCGIWNVCAEPYGTPCDLDGDEYAQCGGIGCTDLTSDNQRRAGYCTGYCYDPDGTGGGCPWSNMTCVDFECRFDS